MSSENKANREPSAEKSKKTSSSTKKSPALQSLLEIWDVLAENASPDNPLTISEIADHLETKRNDQFVRSGGVLNPGRYNYSADEAKDISADNSTANNSLPPSGKTVRRHMPQDIDAINTLAPHTVVCEEGKPTVILAYPTQDTLHLVVEDPHGEAKYEGDVSVIFNSPPITSISQASLNRKMPTLIEQFREVSNQLIKRPPILSLSGVVKENGKYVPALEYGSDEGRSSTRRYYLKSLLTSAEWKIFYDLICVYPYISERQTEKFLSVLRRIAPGNQDWPTMRYAPKADASLQFPHIEILDQAIKERKKVSLTYGLYLLEQDKHNKLRPVLRPQLDFRKKLPFVHIVEPYAMMWSNGYYYLVGKTEKGMRNFRMDRVVKVLTLSETFEYDKNFDPYKYRDSSPVMHSGTPVYIRMRCPISLLGAVQDTFGSTVLDYSSRYAPPGSDEKARYTDVSLLASEEGARLFAMEYADQVEVLEPESLRDAIANSLRTALKKYE